MKGDTVLLLDFGRDTCQIGMNCLRTIAESPGPEGIEGKAGRDYLLKATPRTEGVHVYAATIHNPFVSVRAEASLTTQR